MEEKGSDDRDPLARRNAMIPLATVCRYRITGELSRLFRRMDVFLRDGPL